MNARVAPMSWRSEECTGATPLHLAVLHNRSKAVERLLQDLRIDVNALLRSPEDSYPNCCF